MTMTFQQLSSHNIRQLSRPDKAPMKHIDFHPFLNIIAAIQYSVITFRITMNKKIFHIFFKNIYAENETIIL